MEKKAAVKEPKEAKKPVESKEKVAKAPVVEKKHHALHASSKSREDQSCKIKKCKREYKAKGYCTAHYKEWRHGKFGAARYKSCGQMDCRKPMTTNRFGYCENHYQSIYVKGAAPVEVAAPAEKKKEAAA